MRKLLIIVLLVFVTGCVNYVELSDIEVIENLAIDYEDKMYKIAVTTVSKDKEKEYKVKKAQGNTLNDAIQNLKMKENKKIYIAHLNLLLLTKDVVESNLDDVIEFFLNNSESRNDFDIAITEGLDVLDDAKDIKNGIKIVEEDLATTKSILFEEFLSDVLDENTTYLPLVLTNNKIDGIMIIKTFKDMISLKEEECILYNFMDNSIKQTTFREIPVLSSMTSYNFKDGTLNIDINLTTSVNDGKIERKLEEAIKEMFNKYKKKNIDIFNIENKVCNKNTKYCKKHQESLLKDVKLFVDVKLENKTVNDMEVNLK